MSRSSENAELREMTADRLEQELKATRNELFQNRIRYATRNLDHPEPLRRGKKRIARILTLLTQKQAAE